MLTISRSSRVHFVGDSITAAPTTTGQWYDAPGGMLARLSAGLAALAPCCGSPLQWTAHGTHMFRTSQILANVNTMILAYNPTVVFLEAGTNDTIFDTPGSQFSADYAALLAAIQSGLPGVQIGCMSVLCDGEQWSSAGWTENPEDPQILDINTRMEAAAIAAGCTYIDQRATLLAYEMAVNTPEPGLDQGFATSDTVHPTTAGKLVMADACMPHIVFA